MSPWHRSSQTTRHRVAYAAACALVALTMWPAALRAESPETKAAADDSFARYGQEFKGKIAKSYEQSQEWWPSTSKPPAGTANVLLILLDDVGYAHVGSYGGLIATPNLDKLAAGGLRYNNFHTTALCSPSRASLMAGRNPHKISLGSHALTAMGFPGYNGFPPESAKSVAKDFQKAGFVRQEPRLFVRRCGRALAAHRAALRAVRQSRDVQGRNRMPWIVAGTFPSTRTRGSSTTSTTTSRNR